MSDSSQEQRVERRQKLDGRDFVATKLAVPTLIIAFFVQADVQRLDTFDRALLTTLAICAVVAIAVAYDLQLRSRYFALAVSIAIAPLSVAYGYKAQILSDDGKANDKRCLAIQRDMLSAMPLRNDDPDLFQALGCHPQGQGSVYAPHQGDEIDKAFQQSIRRSRLPYRPEI